MKCDLNGKVALITGSARGIGQAIADRFAENGCIVYYSDLDVSAAAEAADRSATGRAIKLDVTCAADIAIAIRAITEDCGKLDILVNNAGVNTLTHRVAIDQFPREEWDRILAVDLTGL